MRAAALGGLAALLAYSHPPSPMDPNGPLIAEKFVSPAGAVHAFLDHATGVVAFGELHQTEKTAGIRSSLARFTDEILPAVAPRASHLIVETWISRGTCGETEQQVTKDVARTTERPAETENEIVRLLRRAKELGVAPHVLDVDCHEYQKLVGADGAVDYDRLLTMTGQHLGRAIEQALALPRPADRPLVLVYGGALHNDLLPNPELAKYSFGPAIDALTHGDYREIDLFVPELVDTMPALRAERWYAAWRPTRTKPGATLVRRQPRSAVLLFEDQATRRKKYEAWLGPQTVALLQAPDRIEAFAVRPWSSGYPPPGHENDPPPKLPPGTPVDIGGHPVYAVGRRLTVDFARRLTAVVLDDGTYSARQPPFDDFVMKSCMFDPGVGYRIWSGARAVDVLFCFRCDQMVLRPVPNPRKEFPWMGADVDNAHTAFVALAKEALPGVPAVQAVSEIRPP
ncbi:MAG TPA: hypothetical protein VGP64_00830 [Polyangia bacterium]